MRLTVNLENDLYAVAKSLAKAEDCTISAAVNRLLRRSLSKSERDPTSRSSIRPAKRNGFVVSRGSKPITADTVREIENEDDEA
jgi:predicted DNA-binding ribbon-helix-helix protein